MSEIDAIYSIWKREIIRFLRSKSRIIGSLGMPFMFLAIMGTGLNSAMASQNIGGNYLAFITPGILAMVLLTGSLFAGILVLMDRQFGFLKETLIAPVSRPSIVIGKILGGATTAIIQGLLMLVIATVLGVGFPLSALLPAFGVMALISMAFVALGIALASVMDDMHGFQLIMNFLIMPMFFLSGALFPLTTAPDIVKMISALDPLTYGVDALRSILLGYGGQPLALSLGILSGFLIICATAAVYLFNRIES